MVTIPKQKLIKVLILIGIFILINFFLFSITPQRTIVNLDGTLVPKAEMKSLNIRILLMNVPIIGFILSLFFSFIPYKKMKWSKKYLYFSLIIILVLQILLATSNIIRLLL